MMTLEYERLIKETSVDGEKKSALGHGGRLIERGNNDASKKKSHKILEPSPFSGGSSSGGLRLRLAECEKDGIQRPTKESR